MTFLKLLRGMSIAIVQAFCFTHPLINFVLHIICLPFTLRLTRLGMKMERHIVRDASLQGACRWVMRIGSRGMQIAGAEHVPQTGPLLIVGNHAGLGDAHALIAASPRTDTVIMAKDNPILRDLPHMRRHVIIIDEAGPEQSLRAALRHLRAGKSLLVFPRGEIEADPSLDLDGAISSLEKWSRSTAFFARHVPDLQVLPFAVGGLLSRRALSNFIVKRYRDKDKRHFLAATFQMLFTRYRDPVVSLHIGAPVYGDGACETAVTRQMRRLMRAVHEQQSDAYKESAID